MLRLNYYCVTDYKSDYSIGKKLRKVYYIIFILLVCLTINSCAEIERSSDSESASLTDEVWFSTYDILVGTVLNSSDNLFTEKLNSTEQGGIPNTENKNIFLVKKNLSGNREWIIDLGISDKESGISLTSDSYDNVYITVCTKNSFEGNKNSGDFTVFLIKYDSTGSRKWIKELGKSEVENGARLIVDSSDNIFVTGFYNGFESSKKFVSRKTLLAKYDTSGKIKWTKTLESILTDNEWDLTVDSKDNIYLTEILGNSFTQNTSWKEDILLMKFNKDGIKL